MSSDPLPLEYTPLSASHLSEGQTFTIAFQVQPSSHDKTVSALFDSVDHPPAREDVYRRLLPSELWSMARVLSAAFGRLNELVLMRTAWAIHGTEAPGTPLTAKTAITRVRKGRRPICTTLTETRGAADALLVRADDDVLLMHDCPMPFYVERYVPAGPVPARVLYRASHKVYCRYTWDPAIWINNIHTDDYARQCGFEKGLPEFPVYMDWIYHAAVQAGWIDGPPFSIGLQKILPIYPDDLVDVIACEEDGRLQVRFIREGMDRLVASVVPGVEPTRRVSARHASATP